MTKAKIDEIPCIFPASREFGFRDEFAPDCPLQQRVSLRKSISGGQRRFSLGRAKGPFALWLKRVVEAMLALERARKLWFVRPRIA